jgi:hypothetical protein
MQNFNSPVFRAFSWILKIAIVIAAAFYIYQKVFHRNDAGVVLQRLSDSFQAHVFLFAGSFLLMFVNWGIEAFKWKLLLRKILHISYFNAFRSVLAGVTTGIFTPNRAGEFGGRVFSLQEGHRIEATFLSFAGGLVQLSVTLIAAVPAIFLGRMPDMDIRWHFQIALLFVLLAVACLSVMWVFRRRLVPKVSEYLRRFPVYSLQVWLLVFFLSGARYVVFSIQFFLLLKGCGIELHALQAYPAIALSFFAISVIPTFALSEVGIRGSASVLFIGLFSTDTVGILAASILLWIINIALPAIAGSFFVLRINPFGKASSG